MRRIFVVFLSKSMDQGPSTFMLTTRRRDKVSRGQLRSNHLFVSGLFPPWLSWENSSILVICAKRAKLETSLLFRGKLFFSVRRSNCLTADECHISAAVD